MAKVPGEISIVPSLLDRLLDDTPEYFNLRELKQSVARDIQALLNTRQEAIRNLIDGFNEASHSLITYGLPDLLTYNFRDSQARGQICRILEQTLDQFEPRLKRVRVTLEPPREHERALRFRVDAVLEVLPAREQVTFDAVLQLSNHEYKIKSND